VASSFQEWLQQGENLYNSAMREYHDIERQLSELEARLVEKQNEVNQLVSAEVVDLPERAPTPGSNANIARALTGKFGR
jgi:hypothetical protein